jgi:membrane protein required for colicin V production
MTTNLNWVDYIILAIFFLSILLGFARGLIKEVISLITLVVAFVVAITFSNSLAAAFTSSTSVQNAVNQASTAIGVNTAQTVSYAALGISFGLLFVATIIVGAIVGSILSLAFQAGILGLGNRLLGGVFGFFRGLLINLVIIFVIQLTSMGNQPWWHQSQFVIAFQPAVQWLGDFVSPSLANLKIKFEETLQNVNSSIKKSISSGVSNF